MHVADHAGMIKHIGNAEVLQENKMISSMYVIFLLLNRMCWTTWAPQNWMKMTSCWTWTSQMISDIDMVTSSLLPSCSYTFCEKQQNSHNRIQSPRSIFILLLLFIFSTFSHVLSTQIFLVHLPWFTSCLHLCFLPHYLFIRLYLFPHFKTWHQYFYSNQHAPTTLIQPAHLQQFFSFVVLAFQSEESYLSCRTSVWQRLPNYNVI